MGQKASLNLSKMEKWSVEGWLTFIQSMCIAEYSHSGMPTVEGFGYFRCVFELTLMFPKI